MFGYFRVHPASYKHASICMNEPIGLQDSSTQPWRSPNGLCQSHQPRRSPRLFLHLLHQDGVDCDMAKQLGSKISTIIRSESKTEDMMWNTVLLLVFIYTIHLFVVTVLSVFCLSMLLLLRFTLLVSPWGGNDLSVVADSHE